MSMNHSNPNKSTPDNPRRLTDRWLCDSDTTERLGRATAEQCAASGAAGDEGHIYIDEDDGAVVRASMANPQVYPNLRRVYVEA